MSNPGSTIADNVKQHRLQIRHVTILFIVLLIFQIVVSFLHKTSLQKALTHTQEWYQQDSAERLANLATTSLELLLESKTRKPNPQDSDARKMVQGLNIILSQQVLNQTVQEICIIVPHDSTVEAIDNGQVLYDYMFGELRTIPPPETNHDQAITLYNKVSAEVRRSEQIHTVVEGRQTFHVFVPFVPRGEFVGAVYMKNTPDFSFITREMVSNYDETSVTFSALILFGLLAMFYISSYTLKERNEAQKLLFEKEKEHLAEQIHHEKEMLFTKRIYHTHHKAEKVMGFIKDDLRNLAGGNIEETKARVMKYSNFIARVIYDMKWYDPPVQTFRSPLFRTDVNDVLRFLIRNVFQRVSSNHGRFVFDLQLDHRLPPVHINEFVVWEAFEPIIQNSLEHGGVTNLTVTIRTSYDPEAEIGRVTIADNGVGVPAELLVENDRGVKKLFQENISTKTQEHQHSGYGCYIAHEIATQRCGWGLDVENVPGSGAAFTFTIPQNGRTEMATKSRKHGPSPFPS